VRPYALVETGDSEAIDVSLRRDDAYRALDDCFRDEPHLAQAAERRGDRAVGGYDAELVGSPKREGAFEPTRSLLRRHEVTELVDGRSISSNPKHTQNPHAGNFAELHPVTGLKQPFLVPRTS
jgi:hypothetical protein